jgi:bifunctional non-homologous end joining protein LigD
MRDAHFIEPMPCLAVKKLPEGEVWQYELKLDGYRALAVKHEGRVTLFSRNGKQFNGRFPAIAADFARLPDETIIDGEIVAMDESGRPSFSRLQNFSANANAITFYAFDMPMWKGEDLRTRPLDKRRALLRTKAMPKLPAIHFSDSFPADAEKMISAVRAQGLEGIVAKRRDSLYEPGRNGAWVKMRIGGGQEFVIGGYTPSPKSFDAVLVGYFEGSKLMFAARVRNGFVPALRATVFRKFKGLETRKCPFANLPESEKGRWGEGLTAADMEKCFWLKPKLVAAIEYAEWTLSERTAATSNRISNSNLYFPLDRPFSNCYML